MRIGRAVLCGALAVTASFGASAELQNVIVGGELRIRGNWLSSEAVPGLVQPPPLDFFGQPFRARFVEQGNSNTFVEQRSAVSVEADFTNDVRVFVELDSYDVFGENFRDDPFFGAANSRDPFTIGTGGPTAVGGAEPDNDVDVYQAYIEAEDVGGIPFRVRLGRQELQFGSEWLVGNNSTSAFFTGLSFDGIRFDYERTSWSITGFATYLRETGPVEEDGDVIFSGIYGSYRGIKHLTIEPYWFFLRDGRGSRLGFLPDTSNRGIVGRLLNRIERFAGVDQYSDTTALHTFGLRLVGSYRGFDYETEFAMQQGEAANIVKRFFSPDPATSQRTVYGEDDAEWSNIGVNTELGYTFDIQTNPRLYIGFTYFDGEDRREESFGDWLHTFYVFHETDASINFNRLFSDWEYSEFIDNSDLTNVFIYRAGVSAQLTDAVEALIAASYFKVDNPTTTNRILGIPFIGYRSDDELGWELGLYLTYTYSEDLAFKFGYAHFFADDGVGSNGPFGGLFKRVGGDFVSNNGLSRLGGADDEDADYVFAETSVKF